MLEELQLSFTIKKEEKAALTLVHLSRGLT